MKENVIPGRDSKDTMLRDLNRLDFVRLFEPCGPKGVIWVKKGHHCQEMVEVEGGWLTWGSLYMFLYSHVA